MNQREFTQLCKYHGFSRLSNDFYARCMGDGIYQTIYTGFRKYIHPSSPFYSSEKRKSKYVSISIRSLYSYWPEDVFIPGPNGNGFASYIMSENTKTTPVFYGIEHEYEIMRNKGFDILNSVSTQEDFLELYSLAFTNKNGIRKHDCSLIAPFLLSGDIENAITEICYAYTHIRSGFYKVNAHLLEEGSYEEYYQKEICEFVNLHQIQSLWYAWMSKNHMYFTEYLQDNIEKNLKFIKKYNIPLTPDFTTRKIPTQFPF